MRQRAALRVVGVIALAVAAGASAGCSATDRPAPDENPSASTTADKPQWGLLFYFPSEGPGESAPITAWAPDAGAPRALLELSYSDAFSSATISPDGTRVAWIGAAAGAATDAPHDTLTIANLDGSNRKEVFRPAVDACEPNWTGDGSRVTTMAILGEDAKAGSVDVVSGAFTEAGIGWACHLVWSGDGSTVAYPDGQGKVLIAAVNGSSKHAVPRLGEKVGGRRSFDLSSLSSDGHLLSLLVHTGNTPDGDIGRNLFVNEVVNTQTGQTVALPVGGVVQQAYFLPLGGLVVRTKIAGQMQVFLLAADLNVLASAVEPASLATSVLLGHSARP